MKYRQKETKNLYETLVDIKLEDEGFEHLTFDDIISLSKKSIKPMELCYFYQDQEGHIYFRYFDLTIYKINKQKFITTARKKFLKVMKNAKQNKPKRKNSNNI